MKRTYTLTALLLSAMLSAHADNEILVGSMDVNSTVSESGGAVISIPIDVPSGIGGLQPNLSLAYNSQSGYGLAGWGWNLSGLSSIIRTGSNQFYDGRISGVQFTSDDNLMLDGQRLILQSGINQMPGSTYRTAMESFNLVTCMSFGQGFSVQSKDGTVSLYGTDTDSRLDDGQNGNILSWLISEVTDPIGRKMSFSYLKSTNPNEIYLQRINYSGTEDTGPYYSVSFIYMDAPHLHKSLMKTVSGTPFTLSQSKLLERIIVKYQGDALYTYTLEYNTSQPEPRLTRIKKSDVNGNELSPVSISWNAVGDGLMADRTMSMAKKTTTVYGDFTGDGKTDILSYSPGNATAVLYRNTSSGTTVNYNPVSVNLGRNYIELQTLDYNGDGCMDLVGVYQSGSRYCVSYTLSNGTGFDAACGADVTSGNTDLVCGDFDGDGRDEYIVTANNELHHYERMYPVTITGINSFAGDFCIAIDNFSTQLDFNGNGKTDIFIATSNSLDVYELSEDNETVLNHIISLARSSLGGGVCSPENFLFGDYNGDGTTDFVYCGADSNPSDSNVECRLFLSSTDSFIPERVFSVIGSLSSSSPSFFRSGDVNGDHLTDIISITTSGSTLKVHRVLNTGDSFIVNTVSYNSISLSNISNACLLDMTGNGMADIVCFNGSSHIITKQIYNGNSHLLSSVADGFGNSHSFTYKPITDTSICTCSQSLSYPYALLHSPLYAVSGYNAPFTSRQYQYKNPLFHKQGKGFLGFGEITEADACSNLKTIHTKSLQSYYIYMYPSRDIVKTLDDDDVSTVSYTYSTVRYNNDIRHIFIHPYTTVHEDCLTTLRDSTIQFYDDYGNVTSVTKVTGDMKESLSYNYSNVGSWCANKLIRQSGYNRYAGESSYFHSIYYTYDSQGNLIREVEDSLNALKLVHAYTYDRFGNCTGETVSGSGQTRTQSVTWSDDGRFPLTATDELGMVTTSVYNDTTGLLKSRTTAEGTTTYAYDPFGRMIRSTDPYGDVRTTSMEYVNGINGLKYAITETCTHQSPVTTWYSASGQPLYSMKMGFDDNMVFTAMKYNPDGSKQLVSEPFFASSLSDAMSRTFTSQNATLYTYDDYGRIKSIFSPADRVTYTYNGLSTGMNTRSVRTSTRLNSSGLVESKTLLDDDLEPIVDPDEPIRSHVSHHKSITYTYDPTGAVRTITPQGGTAITMQYDAKGNRIELIDPDAGVICDSYNAFGQQTYHSQSVGNGTLSETGFTYAVNGRLVADSITGNETISRHYTYDSRFPDLVRRIEYDNDDYVSYTYDRFGRLSRSDRQAGSTTLSDAYSYTAGLLMSHKHIVSGVCKTEETFTYDNFGHLVKSGISPSTTVWELLEVNPRGQVVQEKKGNIVTTYTYDDAGRILNISAPGIVDLSYTYDYAGNVLTKTDDITNQRASYTYDGKRRLTSWRTECPYLDSDPVADLSLRSAPLLVDVTHTITYDGSTGNITSKSDIGTNTSFTYNPQDKPHALRSVSGVTANWGTNTASIGYNDYGQLETIEQDNTTYSIQYSPDGRRIKSDLREGNSTFTVRYYGNGIEKAFSGSDDIDYLTYLCSGAIVVHHEGSGGALRAAPPSTPTAILQGYYDAQGSLIALVNGNGTVARRYAYDPWGKRVNPTNWTQPDTSADIYHIARGYTMHEHLDNFGLINMNGRVFDPSVAQFLSPDNYIQSDGNWLNYNRYAYCYNNPLSYTDPSGEIVWETLLLSALIGGTTNVLGNMNNITSAGSFFAFFGVGAAVGVLSGCGASIIAGISQAAGVGAGILAGAGTGALSGATSSYLINGCNNLVNGHSFNANWQASLMSGAASGAISGAISGGIRGYKYAKENGADPWNRNYIDNSDKGKYCDHKQESFYATSEKTPVRQPDKTRHCYGYADEFADQGHFNHSAYDFISASEYADGCDPMLSYYRVCKTQGRMGLVAGDQWKSLGYELSQNAEVLSTTNNHAINVRGITIGYKLHMFGGGVGNKLYLFSAYVHDPLIGGYTYYNNLDYVGIIKY